MLIFGPAEHSSPTSMKQPRSTGRGPGTGSTFHHRSRSCHIADVLQSSSASSEPCESPKGFGAHRLVGKQFDAAMIYLLPERIQIPPDRLYSALAWVMFLIVLALAWCSDPLRWQIHYRSQGTHDERSPHGCPPFTLQESTTGRTYHHGVKWVPMRS